MMSVAYPHMSILTPSGLSNYCQMTPRERRMLANHGSEITTRRFFTSQVRAEIILTSVTSKIQINELIKTIVIT